MVRFPSRVKCLHCTTMTCITDLQLAKQEFARKEQIVRDQVQRLRDIANERMTRLVDDVVASTSGKGRGGTGGSTATATQHLRARIQDAIDIMQRGLIERDTEVCRQHLHTFNQHRHHQ